MSMCVASDCVVLQDAAAASNIMQEIVRMAKEENLIVFCTIHQPSTKVRVIVILLFILTV